jgi:HK97 family phage major capsid protein
MGIKIKDSESLEAFANETASKLEVVQAVKAQADTLAAELAAEKETSAELKRVSDLFEEKIKSLEIMFKSLEGPSKEDSEEGRLYRLGSMVNALVKAHKGAGTERAQAANVMKSIGAFPAKNVAGVGGIETFSLREGYEAKWRQQMHKHFGGYVPKAALSSDPLTSDGSDEGSFYGSYLVPVDLVAELQRIAADAGAMMNRVTHIPVRGITTYIPTTTDAMAFTMVTDQETAKTEDTITFARSTLTVQTYAFWLALTDEMDEDSLIGIGNLIRTLGGEAWGIKFDELALSDSTYGAMKTSGVNQVIMGTGSKAFSDVTISDLAKMPNELNTRAKRSGAEFFISPTVWDYLENEKDAQGNYLLRTPAEGAPYRVRGYNVVQSDGMPDSGDSAKSTDVVLLGNPRYIVAGDKTSFEFRVFNQTESSMKYDQIYLRCRVRQAMVNTMPSAFVKLTTAAT